MHGLRTFTNHFPSGFRSKIPPSAVSSQSWAPRIHQELLLPFGHPLLWATKKHAEMDAETPFSGKNKWDGSVWHTTYSIFPLTRQLRAMGRVPLCWSTDQKMDIYISTVCWAKCVFFLTKGFSGNRNPFLDELKSSPQDSARGQSLIYYCQKNVTTNSMFTWLVNVGHRLLRNYPSIK